MKKKLFFLIVFISISLAQKINSTITPLDQSGVFPLGASITADPNTPNDTIISINADNVILDINEYVLNQASTNTTPGLIGIFIKPNVSNITIKNGTIHGLTGFGIHISDGCSQIYLDNVSILNCNQTGILFDGNLTGSGIHDITISNCLISSCTSVDADTAYGLRMIKTYNAEISNCNFNNNKTTIGNEGYGVSIESCGSCEFNNCKSYDNGGLLFSAGIAISDSKGCSFINCSANNNHAYSLIETVSSCGFFVNSTHASLFSSCKSLDNSNPLGSGIGFNIHNSVNNIFEFSLAGNNYGGVLAAGFYFASTNSNSGFSSNVCAANIANFSTGKSYGIILDGAQGFLISNSTFTNNLGAQGYGLVDTTLDTNNLIINNLSYNNTTTGYSVVFTEGEFPVSFAPNNNFATLKNISQYFNVAIID